MQDTAVLVASGNLSIRQVLADMVRGEPGFRLVGEAGSEVACPVRETDGYGFVSFYLSSFFPLCECKSQST